MTDRTPLGELEFHRLLVAIDGSDGADLALSAAVTTAHRNHAAVTLVAVSPPVRVWPGAAMAGPALQAEIDEGMQRVLREAVERIPEDVPVTTVFRQGKAGPEIVALAKSGHYDAILIGARGVGRLGTLVGSVSQYVLNHSPIAVMVAHPPPVLEDDA